MEFDEATRQVIARALRERRASLGLSQEAAALASGGMISTANLRVFEGAGRATFRQKSLIGVARAMRWPADAIARIAEGEDPAGLETVGPDGRSAASSRPSAVGVELATAEQVEQLQMQVDQHRQAIAELGRQLADVIAELGVSAPQWTSDLLTAAHSGGTDVSSTGSRRSTRPRVQGFDPADGSAPT